MAGIRVSTSVKKIDVNDNGDYIELNFSDSTLQERFFGMFRSITNRANEADKKAEEIEKEFGDDKFSIAEKQSVLYRQLNEGIMNEIDDMFGADTCKHIFGDIIPSTEFFFDFFGQLIPFFEEYNKERDAKLSKYSAARTGNV